MKNIFISVIIPVYNVSAYLKQCLDSVIQQTYPHLEIIIVNDGSIDDSLSICEEYQLKDSRIKLINQDNAGVSAARNNGLQAATADYILFLDGDDWLEQDTIAVALFHIEDKDLFCFSYFKNYLDTFAIRKLGLDGNFQGSFVQRRITGLVKEELVDPGQSESLVTVWGKLYRTSIIKENQIQFRDLKEIGTWEDGLFNWEYLNFSKSVYILDQPFYHYRKINSNSITSNYKKQYPEQQKKLFQILTNYLDTYHKEPVFYEAFNNRICSSVIGIGLNEALNPASFRKKLANMKKLLSSELYRKAVKDLPLNYFPIHWKLFFFFAKNSMALPLLFMLMVIKRIINK